MPVSPANNLAQRRARQEALHAKVAITMRLAELEKAARLTLTLESELTRFANDYYEAVGQYAEHLAHLEAQGVCALTAPDAPTTRDGELKKLYRALAKELHPDRNGDATRMQRANEAYHAGDYAALLCLQFEQEMEGAEDWKIQLAYIESAITRYRAQYETWLNSPIYALWEKATEARLAGKNWLQAVIGNIRKEIERHQRALASAQIVELSAWRQAVA